MMESNLASSTTHPTQASASIWAFPGCRRNQRRLFRELIESHIPELEALIGQQLHLKDPYFWVAISGDIKAQQDWPRQHQWIREIAGKFLSVFKPRIGIE